MARSNGGAALLATFFLLGCAADVEEITITSVRLPSATTSTDKIPYGSKATVNVAIKMDEPVSAKAGQTVKVQLWDDDGAADDQITKEKKLTIKQNKTRGNVKISIECTDKGELKGNKGTDTDDGSNGAVREYELYAYETVDQELSAETAIKCVPKEEASNGAIQRAHPRRPVRG